MQEICFTFIVFAISFIANASFSRNSASRKIINLKRGGGLLLFLSSVIIIWNNNVNANVFFFQSRFQSQIMMFKQQHHIFYCFNFRSNIRLGPSKISYPHKKSSIQQQKFHMFFNRTAQNMKALIAQQGLP